MPGVYACRVTTRANTSLADRSNHLLHATVDGRKALCNLKVRSQFGRPFSEAVQETAAEDICKMCRRIAGGHDTVETVEAYR